MTVLPKPSGNPSGSGNISSYTPPLITIHSRTFWLLRVFPLTCILLSCSCSLCCSCGPCPYRPGSAIMMAGITGLKIGREFVFATYLSCIYYVVVSYSVLLKRSSLMTKVFMRITFSENRFSFGSLYKQNRNSLFDILFMVSSCSGQEWYQHDFDTKKVSHAVTYFEQHITHPTPIGL